MVRRRVSLNRDPLPGSSTGITWNDLNSCTQLAYKECDDPPAQGKQNNFIGHRLMIYSSEFDKKYEIHSFFNKSIDKPFFNFLDNKKARFIIKLSLM